MQSKFETLAVKMACMEVGKSMYKFKVPFISDSELRFLVKLGSELGFTTCIKRSGNGVTVICEYV